VILLAAGDGRRVGASTNKVLLPLLDRPVLAWSLRAVAALEHVDRLVVVVRPQDRTVVQGLLDRHSPRPDVRVVDGGPSRHASERNGLLALGDVVDAGAVDVVAVHDTARPLAGADLFDRVVRAAAEHGGALPAREQTHLVHRDPGRPPVAGQVVTVQTPQAFRAVALLAAYRAADGDGFEATDTAGCFTRYTELPVRAVAAPATNLKITFPEDVALAERLLRDP